MDRSYEDEEIATGMHENDFTRWAENEILKFKTGIVDLPTNVEELILRRKRKEIFIQCLLCAVNHIEDPYQLHRTST